MRLRRTTLATLVAAGALLAALAIRAFIQHKVLIACSNPPGNRFGAFCSRQERPGWVDPVALALVAFAVAAIGQNLVPAMRLRGYFAKPS